MAATSPRTIIERIFVSKPDCRQKLRTQAEPVSYAAIVFSALSELQRESSTFFSAAHFGNGFSVVRTISLVQFIGVEDLRRVQLAMLDEIDD